MHRIHNHLETHRLQAAAQGGEIKLAAKAFEVFTTAVKACGDPLHRWRDATSRQALLHRGSEVSLH